MNTEKQTHVERIAGTKPDSSITNQHNQCVGSASFPDPWPLCHRIISHPS